MERPLDEASGRTSQALANLRGVFILILVAFHSCLAYLGSTAGPSTAFDAPPYAWLSFPVVDERRFFGFDLYCAWEDVHVMAMMFFLSGVFMPESLRRKGVPRFVADRLARLGIPFVFGLAAVAPLAIYPVFHRLNPEAGLGDYLSAYVGLPFTPNGPPWFLWLLIVFSLTGAPGVPAALTRLAAGARRRPWPFLAMLALVAALAYVPLALRYGPFDWFERGPLSFQKSRPLLYGVFFFAGAAVGGTPLGAGLLAPDGEIVRRWLRLAVAALSMLFVWMGLTGVVLTYPSFAPPVLQTLSALAYTLASVAGVMSLLAVTLRFCARRIAWLEPLTRNALGVFVLHYAPMVWLQSALTGVNLPAIPKAAIVFALTLSLSLALASAMRRLPGLALLVGERTPPALPLGRPAPAGPDAAA